MDSSEQANLKDKERWTGIDFQKLGIIGVLVFFSQFLMDNIRNDNKGIETEIKALTQSVNTVIIKQEVMQQTLAGNVSNTKKDVGFLQGQIDTLTKDSDSLEKQIRNLEAEFRLLKNSK